MASTRCIWTPKRCLYWIFSKTFWHYCKTTLGHCSLLFGRKIARGTNLIRTDHIGPVSHRRHIIRLSLICLLKLNLHLRTAMLGRGDQWIRLFGPNRSRRVKVFVNRVLYDALIYVERHSFFFTDLRSSFWQTEALTFFKSLLLLRESSCLTRRMINFQGRAPFYVRRIYQFWRWSIWVPG